MRKILHRFNMVEIVLAIGVVAFGITGVMALLPPALNANRDTVNDVFVDEAISKMRLLFETFFRRRPWKRKNCFRIRTFIIFSGSSGTEMSIISIRQTGRRPPQCTSCFTRRKFRGKPSERGRERSVFWKDSEKDTGFI